jgi:hypothetical protein
MLLIQIDVGIIYLLELLLLVWINFHLTFLALLMRISPRVATFPLLVARLALEVPVAAPTALIRSESRSFH